MVDLESAAYVAAAGARAIPWVVLRAVSDRADENLPALLNRSLDSGGAVNRGRVLRGLFGDPGALPQLLALRKRVGQCAEVLARAAEARCPPASARRCRVKDGGRAILDALAARAGEKFTLHEQYLNPKMVQVLKTIGFDRHYVRAEGAYLYDREGQRYLDLLSGFGVFAIGRNHPTVKRALADVLAADLSDLVQMDVSPLAGMLAEKLVAQHARPGARLLLQLGDGGGRGGDQAGAPGHPPRRSWSTATTPFTA